MTRAHTAAVIAALKADPGLVVFEGIAPDGQPYPYALVRPGLATDRQERLTGPQSTFNPSYTVLACGGDPDQAEWVAEHVDTALRPRGRGILPVVPGRSTGPVNRDSLQPLLPDDDSQPPGWYRVAEYSFRSAPTS
jgi:hypothetical protein